MVNNDIVVYANGVGLNAPANFTCPQCTQVSADTGGRHSGSGSIVGKTNGSILTQVNTCFAEPDEHESLIRRLLI